MKIDHDLESCSEERQSIRYVKSLKNQSLKQLVKEEISNQLKEINEKVSKQEEINQIFHNETQEKIDEGFKQINSKVEGKLKYIFEQMCGKLEIYENQQALILKDFNSLKEQLDENIKNNQDQPKLKSEKLNQLENSMENFSLIQKNFQLQISETRQNIVQYKDQLGGQFQDLLKLIQKNEMKNSHLDSQIELKHSQYQRQFDNISSNIEKILLDHQSKTEMSPFTNNFYKEVQKTNEKETNLRLSEIKNDHHSIQNYIIQQKNHIKDFQEAQHTLQQYDRFSQNISNFIKDSNISSASQNITSDELVFMENNQIKFPSLKHFENNDIDNNSDIQSFDEDLPQHYQITVKNEQNTVIFQNTLQNLTSPEKIHEKNKKKNIFEPLINNQEISPIQNYISPKQSNNEKFFTSPVITLYNSSPDHREIKTQLSFEEFSNQHRYDHQDNNIVQSLMQQREKEVFQQIKNIYNQEEQQNIIQNLKKSTMSIISEKSNENDELNEQTYQIDQKTQVFNETGQIMVDSKGQKINFKLNSLSI